MTTSPATFQNNVGFYLIRRSISSGFRKRIESLQMLLYTSPYISAVTTEKEEKKKKKKKKTTTEYSTHVIHAEKNIYIYLYRVHISRRPWPRSLRMSFRLYTFASGELLVWSGADVRLYVALLFLWRLWWLSSSSRCCMLNRWTETFVLKMRCVMMMMMMMHIACLRHCHWTRNWDYGKVHCGANSQRQNSTIGNVIFCWYFRRYFAGECVGGDMKYIHCWQLLIGWGGWVNYRLLRRTSTERQCFCLPGNADRILIDYSLLCGHHHKRRNHRNEMWPPRQFSTYPTTSSNCCNYELTD